MLLAPKLPATVNLMRLSYHQRRAMRATRLGRHCSPPTSRRGFDMRGALIGPGWRVMVNSYPSPGLGYLSAIAEREGHEAAVLDIGLRPASRLRPALALRHPPVDFLVNGESKRAFRDCACPNLWYHTQVSSDGRIAMCGRGFNPAYNSATRANRTATKTGARPRRPATLFDRVNAA